MGKWTPKAKPDILFSRVGTNGEMKYGFNARPHLLSSPRGKEIAVAGFGFTDDRPANSVARFFKKNGERFTFFPHCGTGLRADVSP
jgi:hypothetical protein